MTPAQTIAPWLGLLCDPLRCEPAEEQSPGHYLLRVQQAQELLITVPNSLPIVRLFTTLVPVPAEHRSRLYMTLLEWNLLGQKTNGTALALSPDGTQVTLTYGHPLDQLDGERFVLLVQNFLAIAQTLRNELDGSPASRSERPHESTHDAMPLHPLRG